MPKKVSLWVVELSSGKAFRRPPPFPFGDCRGCSLIGWLCVELDYPCNGCADDCIRNLKNPGYEECERCEERVECLDGKPCCWECRHLLECVGLEREGWGEDFAEAVFGDPWDEVVEAVKMLWRPSKR
jgi:hypothetical protein